MFSINELKVTSKDGKQLAEVKGFKVKPKTISLLVGKNGSGKTSFLNGIFLYPNITCEERNIFLDDIDISLDQVSEIFLKGIYYVPQNLLPLPGVSFISFLHTAHENLFSEKISLVAFAQKVKSLCDDYALPQYLLEKNVHENLSGGERKIQELIQLIVLNPKCVFLDEIDAGLDRDLKVLVASIINRLKDEGAAITLVSHSFEFTELLKIDNVYLMNEGKIVSYGGLDIINTIKSEGFSN